MLKVQSFCTGLLKTNALMFVLLLGSLNYIFICLLLQFDTATIKANKNNPGKQFSPIVFYGSPNGVPPKRPSSLLQLLHQIRVDLSEQNKLNSRYLCDPILPFDWCLSYTIILVSYPMT